MAQAALPLTALSEAQRTQALERLEIIRPAVEKHISQAQGARLHHLPPGTVQLWIKRYREKGLAGLANARRSDKGKSRKLPQKATALTTALTLRTAIWHKDDPRWHVCGIPTVYYTELTLAAFEQRFRTWLLEEYHTRIHSETKCAPAVRWEAGGFLPRLPHSLERLDLLLLTVAKTRRVQQDETFPPKTETREPAPERPRLKRYINE
jgi:hypothetical protein